MKMGMGGSLSQKVPSAVIANRGPQGPQKYSLCLREQGDYLQLGGSDFQLLEDSGDIIWFSLAFQVPTLPDFGNLEGSENYKEMTLLYYGNDAGSSTTDGMFIEIGLLTSGIPGTSTQIGRYYCRSSHASDGIGNFYSVGSMETPLGYNPVWPPVYWNQVLIKMERSTSSVVTVSIYDRHLVQGDNTLDGLSEVAESFTNQDMDVHFDAFEYGKRSFYIGKNLELDNQHSSHSTDRFHSFQGLIDEFKVFDFTGSTPPSTSDIEDFMQDGTQALFDANQIAGWDWDGDMVADVGGFILAPLPHSANFISWNTTDFQEWIGEE